MPKEYFQNKMPGRISKSKIDKQIRVAIEFDRELLDIKTKKLANGTSNNLKSDRRITQAIIRHPDFIRIKDDIINQELLD